MYMMKKIYNTYIRIYSVTVKLSQSKEYENNEISIESLQLGWPENRYGKIVVVEMCA